MEIEFHDRYSALGIERPNPETVCRGQCEGTGWFPEDDQTSPLWIAAHRKCTRLGWLRSIFERVMIGDFATAWFIVRRHWLGACDGWHFVKCPDCNGTGRR